MSAEAKALLENDVEPRRPTTYKLTELGMLPQDWELAVLGEKTDRVGSGLTPTGGERVYKSDGRPFVRSQNVGWGHLILDDLAFIAESTHAGFSATEIREKDVLLNITGASIGRCALADTRIAGGNVNQHVCEIRSSAGQLHPFFLMSFLISNSGQRQIDAFQSGGNRQGLNFGQIRSFRIPCPKYEEQRAIAVALSDVDALVGALDKLIAKKRAIKLATMQQLLTGQRRLVEFERVPGFQQTPVGKIPKDWDIAAFDELCLKIQDGTHFSPKVGGNDYLYVTSRNIGYGFLDLTDVDRIDSAQHRAIYSRCDVQKGDLLLTKDGANTGNAAINTISDEFSLLSSVAFCRFKPSCDARFFLQYILSRTGQQRLKDLMSGNAITRLTLQKIRSFAVPVPGFEEQCAIADILSDMDIEITALERRLDKTKAIKQGMMQVLLTGKVRLV